MSKEPLTYERYCEIMEKMGHVPMTLAQWNKCEEDQDETVRKNRNSRLKKPTLEEHPE